MSATASSDDELDGPAGLTLARGLEELTFAPGVGDVLQGRLPPVAFVPTMGALHAGHATLIERAAAAMRRVKGGTVVVSIFVNPTQFGPGEDLERYPRTLEADLKLCREAGADVVFAPSVRDMYPDEHLHPGGIATTVRVGGPLTNTLEGAHRPNHFDGVATVVLKLLNMVRPAFAFFGEKDWQQLAVVRTMANDLNLPYLIESVPTVRDADGLALSSRNRYLSPEQRKTAAELPAALFAARDAIEAGAVPADVERTLADRLTAAGFAVDYAAVRCPTTLRLPPEWPPFSVRILVAAKLGGTRLIDNVAATQRV
ncbi:pantoate--beta-alanine ligase [Alienimonas californiensis]|uniref:Pantothenate synthetase n=1 Tax=Alienimonas californiensis TaxID=2527989 RepID=A0A517PET7_9PLAN|nr:pantoate--beta-alanine ligase [Alienimonas californiensis]QDT17887.1 Pantoate-beta-alanine ligase [Alienimonas californiensis]